MGVQSRDSHKPQALNGSQPVFNAQHETIFRRLILCWGKTFEGFGFWPAQHYLSPLLFGPKLYHEKVGNDTTPSKTLVILQTKVSIPFVREQQKKKCVLEIGRNFKSHGNSILMGVQIYFNSLENLQDVKTTFVGLVSSFLGRIHLWLQCVLGCLQRTLVGHYWNEEPGNRNWWFLLKWDSTEKNLASWILNQQNDFVSSIPTH